MVSAMILLTTLSWLLLTTTDQQLLTDGGYDAFEDSVESLDGMLNKCCSTLAGKLETQARVIDDLVVEKQKWQQDKTNLLANMASLMEDNLSLRQGMASLWLTVRRLEGSLSSKEPNLPVTVNENDSEDQSPQLTKGTSVTEAHKPAIFVRSDDTNPLVPVLTQLTERINQVSASLQAITNKVNEGLPEASTSVFVNWGSSTCPGSAEIVYSGTVGGSYYNDSGAAANYLCLPLNNIVLIDNRDPYDGYLYGGEYETYDEHYEKDPLCAVCRSSHATNVMIPATTVCPAGWTSEYSGWLMAGHPDHRAASEFICVNTKMEERQGSEENKNGKLMYYTLARCGSLPCPPFVNTKRVPCVVCSK